MHRKNLRHHGLFVPFHKREPWTLSPMTKEVVDLSNASHILDKVEEAFKKKRETTTRFCEFLHWEHRHAVDFDVAEFMKGYPLTCEYQKLALVKPGSWGIFEFIDTQETIRQQSVGATRLNQIWNEMEQEKVMGSTEADIDNFFETLPNQKARPYKIDLLDRNGCHKKPFIDLDELDSPLRHIFNKKKQMNFPWSGILIPNFLVGGCATMSSRHLEDSSMGSINVMDYAAPGAKALWVIINRKDNQKVIDLLKKETGIHCDNLLLSKNYVFSPSRLKHEKIDFESVWQKKGQAMVIGAGVLHWVFNTGFTIKSASNFIPTDEQMLKIMDETRYCECPGIEVDGLVIKRKHGQDLRQLLTNIRNAVAEWKEIKRLDERAESFRKEKELRDKEEMEKTKKNKKVPCPICNILVTVRNISAHKKTHVKLQLLCDSCGKSFSQPRYLLKHVKSKHPV